jgi:hypothetical protein
MKRRKTPPVHRSAVRLVPKYKIGRKVNLTSALISNIRRMMQVVYFDRHCFQALQIKESTWYRWKQRGKELADLAETGKLPPAKSLQEHDEIQLLIQFWEAVEQGRAMNTVAHITNIVRSGQKTGGLSKWWVQVTHPDLYGEADATKVNMNVGLDYEKMHKALRAAKEERNGNGKKHD